MKITLPDNSIVYLDRSTFRFYREKSYPESDFQIPLNYDMLQQYLEQPHLKFGKCFRRINDTPCYTGNWMRDEYDTQILCATYDLKPGEGSYGMMFTSSHKVYHVLDGCVIEHLGYGWGSHTYNWIEGFEVLKATCLFNGIQQPQRLKGDTNPRPLADILADLNKLEINHHLYAQNLVGYDDLLSTKN